MKKLSLITFALLLITLLNAHPAGNVSLSYDAKTSQLSVKFDHSVKSAAEHYIQTLTVKVNNKTVISQIYTLQELAAGGSAVYRIPGLKKGDAVEAITDCNKGGKKSGKITIK